MNISLVIPARNNLKYLKWCYDAIRTNLSHRNHEICVADDASTDGTWEWCEAMHKQDPYFKAVRNEGPARKGMTELYNILVEKVATCEVVMIYHADMYISRNADLLIEKHLKPQTVVCLTRVEPPLHPGGPEKIVMDFGVEPESFKKMEFDKWLLETKATRKDKTTEGVFAPWAIYKQDFLSIGGHDLLFAPTSKEDSDIFNRFLLSGYKFVQLWEACVYHLTCRGSRFNPTITSIGTDSTEWQEQNVKSARNFIRKWGHFVKHNDMMKPVVPNRYNVGFVVLNCDEYRVALLEPWCDTLYTDVPYSRYIAAEQKNTKFDLVKKLKTYEEPKTNDVLVTFDGNKVTNQSFEFFNMLQMMLEDSGTVGELEYDIFKLKINRLVDYKQSLINVNDDDYKKRLL
jgi:glycosyltransferase involved in cell wall biosynthesis